MKRALSLVEMMIAVILFGVMSMVGFKYYKSFYNSGDITKKTNLGAVVDQASQLSNAYDIYEIQVGISPSKIEDLVANNVQILSSIPEGIEAMTGDSNASVSWRLVRTANIDGSSNDVAFIYPLGTTDDQRRYCQLFNNIVNNTLSVNRTINSTFSDAYTSVSSVSFCAKQETGTNILGDNNETLVAGDQMYIVFPKNMPINYSTGSSSSSSSSSSTLPSFSSAPSVPSI
jgi:prepilin-type N-terminal cleavage/methylation domain-containing protein